MRALRRIGLLALIISFLTINLSYAQSFAEQNWTKGVVYAAQGKFKEAKGEFEKALKIDPFYGPAKRALEVIEDAIGQKIKSKTAIHLFKGISYGKKEHWDESAAELNKAIELNPGYAYAYHCRGLAYQNKGRHDQAISDYTKAIELNPRDTGAYVNRGYAYQLKGQHEKAISDYTRTIELNPGNTYAYYNRGVAMKKLGNMKKACSDWKRACELGDCRYWGIVSKIRCFGKLQD